MSNLKYTVSIKSNSNRIISSSEEKFIGIRDNSLIRLENDSNLYTIIGRNNYFFIKNFNSSDSRTIVIDENIGINLQAGDTINISFKEYELLTVLDIINGGANYQTSEEIIVNNGVLNIDISSGVGNPTILEVKEVDSNGKITMIGIKEKGRYLQAPDNPVEVNSQDGIGAKFELKYQESSNRSIIEREIEAIYLRDNKTIITLNYSLPLNLKGGKLSVEKHYLEISPNYFGPDRINATYQVFKDYTPHCKLPLAARNSLSLDLVFNKAMQQIDAELKSIKEKIKL